MTLPLGLRVPAMQWMSWNTVCKGHSPKSMITMVIELASRHVLRSHRQCPPLVSNLEQGLQICST